VKDGGTPPPVWWWWTRIMIGICQGCASTVPVLKYLDLVAKKTIIPDHGSIYGVCWLRFSFLIEFSCKFPFLIEFACTFPSFF